MIEQDYKTLSKMLHINSNVRNLNVILARQLESVKKYTPKEGLVIFDQGKFHPMITSTSLIETLHKEFGVTTVLFYTTKNPNIVPILDKNTEYKCWYTVETSTIFFSGSIGKEGSLNLVKSRDEVRKNVSSWSLIGDNHKIDLHLHDGSFLLCM